MMLIIFFFSLFFIELNMFQLHSTSLPSTISRRGPVIIITI